MSTEPSTPTRRLLFMKSPRPGSAGLRLQHIHLPPYELPQATARLSLGMPTYKSRKKRPRLSEHDEFERRRSLSRRRRSSIITASGEVAFDPQYQGPVTIDYLRFFCKIQIKQRENENNHAQSQRESSTSPRRPRINDLRSPLRTREAHLISPLRTREAHIISPLRTPESHLRSSLRTPESHLRSPLKTPDVFGKSLPLPEHDDDLLKSPLHVSLNLGHVVRKREDSIQDQEDHSGNEVGVFGDFELAGTGGMLEPVTIRPKETKHMSYLERILHARQVNKKRSEGVAVNKATEIPSKMTLVIQDMDVGDAGSKQLTPPQNNSIIPHSGQSIGSMASDVSTPPNKDTSKIVTFAESVNRDTPLSQHTNSALSGQSTRNQVEGLLAGYTPPDSPKIPPLQELHRDLLERPSREDYAHSSTSLLREGNSDSVPVDSLPPRSPIRDLEDIHSNVERESFRHTEESGNVDSQTPGFEGDKMGLQSAMNEREILESVDEMSLPQGAEDQAETEPYAFDDMNLEYDTNDMNEHNPQDDANDSSQLDNEENNESSQFEQNAQSEMNNENSQLENDATNEPSRFEDEANPQLQVDINATSQLDISSGSMNTGYEEPHKTTDVNFDTGLEYQDTSVIHEEFTIDNDEEHQIFESSDESVVASPPPVTSILQTMSLGSDSRIPHVQPSTTNAPSSSLPLKSIKNLVDVVRHHENIKKRPPNQALIHDIQEKSNEFLQSMMSDLNAYADHRGSEKIDMLDVLLYLNRIKFNDVDTISRLAQNFLPLELLIALDNELKH